MAKQLLIDVGNTRIKWALNEGEELTQTAARTHRGHSFVELLDMDFANLSPPDRIFISCVADTSIRETIDKWIDVRWQLRPHYLVSTRQAGGIINAYREPHTLGSDRWAAMIGAYHSVGGPVCVIDAGTALTLDAIDADGIHQGGMILPGIYSTQASLLAYTAMSPVTFDIMPMNQLFGKSTQECISRGIQHSLAALFDRVFKHLKQLFGRDPTCLLTGGDAATLAILLPVTSQHDPHLVLKGLAVLVANT